MTAVLVRERLADLREQSLVRNSAAIIATTVANSLLGFAFWTIVARSSSPTEVGIATAAVAAITLVGAVTNPGIHTLLVQILPNHRTTRGWSSRVNGALVFGALASAAGGIIALLILPAVAPTMRESFRDPWFAVAFVAGCAGTTLGMIVDHACIAERRAGLMLGRNVLFSMVRLGIAIAIGAGALAIFGSWVWALVGSVVVTVLFALPRLDVGYRIGTAPVLRGGQRVASQLVGHHFANIGGELSMYVLPLLVTARLSATDNAFFYTTWMLCGAFFMVSPAVASALFAEGANNPGSLRAQCLRSGKIIAAILVPLMVVFVLAGPLVLDVFGQAYSDAATSLLRLLALSAIPDAVLNIYIASLRVQGRLREAATVNLAVGGFAVVASFVLLPHLGIAGAGWGWLLAQLGGTVYALVDLTRRPLPRAAVVPA